MISKKHDDDLSHKDFRSMAAEKLSETAFVPTHGGNSDIEQIQAMWDRWQEAPAYAMWCIIRPDGQIEFLRHMNRMVSEPSKIEQRPSAAIGVLLGVINRLNRLCDNAHGFYDLTLEKRLYAVDVEDIKAAIAGEQDA